MTPKKGLKRGHKKGELPAMTPKKERFCQEYLVDLNLTQAAKRAGYSIKTAYSIGHELMKKPEIQARIEVLRSNQAGVLNITKESLLVELMKIARANIDDLYDPETGALLPMSQWPDHMKGVVSGVEADELYAGTGENRVQIGITKKLKTWDKNKAIETINKMLGFNMPDKVAQTTPDGEALAPVQPQINIQIIQAGVPLAGSETEIEGKINIL